MAAVLYTWAKKAEHISDWKAEVKKHCASFRVSRTNKSRDGCKATKYLKCNEHKNCPKKYRVTIERIEGYDNCIVEESVGLEHSTGKSRGIPKDICELMKPYVGAGLSPKKIRLALRESHNIPEERLPEPKQIANWKMYFHKCKQHDFLMGTNLELRDWAVQHEQVPPDDGEHEHVPFVLAKNIIPIPLFLDSKLLFLSGGHPTRSIQDGNQKCG